MSAKQVLIFCLLSLAIFFSYGFSAERPYLLSFKERILKADPGDYIVTEHNKICTLLVVNSIQENRLILEEISVPLAKKPPSFKKWIEQGAPLNISWHGFEIDLLHQDLVEAYSFSKKGWLDIKKHELFFLKLLSLEFRPIDAIHRKKIGVSPTEEVDHRKFWEPPMLIEGKKFFKESCTPFQALWPSDGSELANKQLEFYFDVESTFPFPYWMEIRESRGSLPLKIVDSGKHLSLPKHTIPKRVPYFLHSSLKRPSGIHLKIYVPPYHRPFTLAAIDLYERKTIPIQFLLKEEKEGVCSLEISKNELEKSLEKDHTYLWLCIPESNPQYTCETLSPFVWSQW